MQLLAFQPTPTRRPGFKPLAAEPTSVRKRTRGAAGRAKRRSQILRRQARERTPGPQAVIVRK